MEYAGINWFVLIAQMINIFLLATWIFLAVKALRQLRQRSMTEAVRFGWAALIVLVPILGALAFLLAQPGEQVARR